jgi:membrane protein implicated in regulation of membrane protease activity
LTIWIVLTVVAVFLEMLTRTFTLLALAIGFATAGLFAWMGFGFPIELIVAALVSFGCMMWLRKSPAGKALQEAEESRYSVISDDGDEVHISEFDNGKHADVVFKGRHWEAKLAEGASPTHGLYRVLEVREGKLVLEEKPKPEVQAKPDAKKAS